VGLFLLLLLLTGERGFGAGDCVRVDAAVVAGVDCADDSGVSLSLLPGTLDSDPVTPEGSTQTCQQAGEEAYRQHTESAPGCLPMSGRSVICGVAYVGKIS
jgi:hypothetical protein